MTATVTADNHYALFYGTESHLTFVGRNEKGTAGNPGQFNWSLPETYFVLAPAENGRFYIVYWDDVPTAGPTALIGQFTTDDGRALLTTPSDWRYFVTTAGSLGYYGDPPSAGELESLISSASWTQPGETALNGADPWGTISNGPIPGISPMAYWLCSASCNDPGNLVVYRSIPISEFSIPMPGTLALLGSSLGILGWSRRRKAREMVAKNIQISYINH